MNSRVNLQHKLEELMTNNNVYYQPPENLKIEYPAIIYSTNDIFNLNANNNKYLIDKQYQVIVIDKKPDNPVILKILNTFKHSYYERHYVSDNLNHDVLILYY